MMKDPHGRSAVLCHLTLDEEGEFNSFSECRCDK
jgi:hypothetical protein